MRKVSAILDTSCFLLLLIFLVTRGEMTAMLRQLRSYKGTVGRIATFRSMTPAFTERDVVVPMDPPSWDKWEYGTFPVVGINSIVTSIEACGDHAVLKKKVARKITMNQYDDEEWKEFNQKSLFDPLWGCLSDDQVSKAIEALEPLATDTRKDKMTTVIAQRTDHVRFIFENPSNANNVWAALRTLDSFGIQFVDLIFNNETYICEWRKSTMAAALGSQKWMSLKQHSKTSDCLLHLKEKGYKIIASDLHASSLDSNRIDWNRLTRQSSDLETEQSPSKIAIVMGNENTGITQATRDLADHLLYIPMKGFAESLNLSVAVAVLCTQLDQQSMLKANLNPSVKDRVLLTWLARTVRGSKKILQRENIEVPYKSLYERIHNVTSRP